MDYTLNDVIYYAFTTRAFATGVPTALAGSPTLEIYENDSVTPIVEGASKLVLTQNLNSINGLNLATITATAANGFEAGKTYHIILKTGTVGGTSAVGEVVGRFTIQADAAFTRVGAPAGASVSADVAAVKVDTAAVKVKTDFLPSVAAGGNGGVFIAGTNDHCTITGDLLVSGTTTLTGAATATNASNDLRGVALSATQAAYAPLLAGSYTAPPSAAAIATAVWAEVLEVGFAAGRILRIIAAAVAGKVSGGPGSPIFRNLVDTQNQITGTADSSGNRTAATYGA